MCIDRDDPLPPDAPESCRLLKDSAQDNGNSPLSIHPKANASRRERVSRRYHETAAALRLDKVDMFHINKSGTTEV